MVFSRFNQQAVLPKLAAAIKRVRDEAKEAGVKAAIGLGPSNALSDPPSWKPRHASKRPPHTPWLTASAPKITTDRRISVLVAAVTPAGEGCLSAWPPWTNQTRVGTSLWSRSLERVRGSRTRLPARSVIVNISWL